MTDSELSNIRLECLKLAITNVEWKNIDTVLYAASLMTNFILTGEIVFEFREDDEADIK